MFQRFVGTVNNKMMGDFPTESWDGLGMKAAKRKSSEGTEERRPKSEEERALIREARQRFGEGMQQLEERLQSRFDGNVPKQPQMAKLLGFPPADRPGDRYGNYARASREPPLWMLAAIRRETSYSLDSLIAGLPPGRPLDVGAITPETPQFVEDPEKLAWLALWGEGDKRRQVALLKKLWPADVPFPLRK